MGEDYGTDEHMLLDIHISVIRHKRFVVEDKEK
jgi:hypothetical protein